LMEDNDSSISQIVLASSPVRSGSERWTEDSISRPHLIHANRLIRERWTPPLFDWKGESITNPELLLIKSGRPPWRDSVKNDVIRSLFDNPNQIPMIQTPNGLLPFDLEDWAPLCHIQASDNTWSSLSPPSNDVLKSLGIDSDNVNTLISSDGAIDKEDRIRIFEWLEFSQISAKCAVLLGASRKKTNGWLNGMTVGRSSTGRIRNVFTSDGRHVLSPRLHDGGISLTNEGAKDIHSLEAGTPRLVLQSDAIPYVQDGRNVIHGFIEDVDANIVPGLACLIQDSSGNLIGHGISRCLPSEIHCFSKGIAIRVRGGIKRDESQ